MGFIDKLKNLGKDKKRLWKIAMVFSIVFFISALVFAIVFIISFLSNASKENILDRESPVSKEICVGCQRRLLDGVYVKEDEANLPTIAVMIDNHPEARPAFGIDKAQLVYEAEVEGRFTRYMAIFSSAENILEIGPVRSARPYFLDWANELNALYCHCGGSPQALAEILDKDIVDLNEFYNGQYYWRDERRIIPHNILTSSENLKKSLKSQEASKDSFKPWKFKEDLALAVAPHSFVEINFPSDSFKVKWEYDKDKNSYLRYLAGEKDITEAGDEIIAKNIVIQYVTAEVIDDKLRLSMDNTGQGRAVFCIDGACANGEWVKASSKERTIFTHENGEEVEFNAGMTWVEIIRPDIEVIF